MELNHQKCELISHDPGSIEEMLCAIQCHDVVNPEVAIILGSPIGGLAEVKGAIASIQSL